MGQNKTKEFAAELEIYDLEHTKKFFKVIQLVSCNPTKIADNLAKHVRYYVKITLLKYKLDKSDKKEMFTYFPPLTKIKNDSKGTILRVRTESLDFVADFLKSFDEVQICNMRNFENPIVCLAHLTYRLQNFLEPTGQLIETYPRREDLIKKYRSQKITYENYMQGFRDEDKIKKFMENVPTHKVFRCCVSYPTLHILQREKLIKQKIFVYNSEEPFIENGNRSPGTFSNIIKYFRQYARRYYTGVKIFIGPFEFLFARIFAMQIFGKIPTSLLFSHTNHPANLATIRSYFPLNDA